MYKRVVVVLIVFCIAALPVKSDFVVPIAGTANLDEIKLKEYIDARIKEGVKEYFKDDQQCSEGWKEFEGSCFLFSASKKSWNDAQYECQLDGGRLAEPKSKLEIDFLKDNAQKEANTFWLGGTDVDNEGEWVWDSTRSEISVIDWHTSTIQEPNNAFGKEHCLSMNKNLLFEWNDANCDNLMRYVCEEI